MKSNVELKPITDIISFIVDNRGKSVPTVDDGFPLIATNCIKHSSIYPTFENIRYISEETLNNWFRAHLQPNDILFVNKGTPGRVCLVPDPVNFCAAQDMIAFRSDESKIYYKYLFAVLRSGLIQKKIKNYHVGLVIPHFKKQDLKSLLIPIKSRYEQEIIGDLYVCLSEKIELNNRINRELEGMAKLLYDYWFVQFDFPMSEEQAIAMGKPELKGKPYKSSGGPMVYNEQLKREIPEGWGCCELKEIAKTGSGGTPLKSKKEYYNGGTIAWVNSGELNEPFIISTDNFITEKGLNESSAKIFEKGTLLMAMYGATAGKVAIMDFEASTNQAICAVLPHKSMMRNYLKFVLEDLYSYLVRLSSGSARDNLSQDRIKNLTIIHPTEDIIKKFDSIAETAFNKILINLKENKELTNIRDWLLPMLMNGQVRVSSEAKKEYKNEGEVMMAADGKGIFK